MKLKKSQIKEFIRHSIYEILSEEDVKDKTIKYKDDEGNEKEATVGGILKKGEDHPAYKDAKSMVDKDSGKEEPEAKKTTISANPFGDDGEEKSEPDDEKPSEDWKNDEQAWADQWDQVQSDVEEFKNNAEEAKEELKYADEDEKEELEQVYQDDREQYRNAVRKFLAFQKVGNENGWLGDDDGEDDGDLQPAEAAFDKIDDFMSDHEGDIPDEYTDALENIQDDLQNAGDDEEVAELESKAEKIMNDIEQMGIKGEFDKETSTDEKPSEDWENDEQAWADQWDQVQSDYQEWKDNIEDTKREFEDDPSDENRENYEDDKEELKKAREKFLAFQKVGRENDWLEESIKESIHESVKPRRSTVKEIKTWMKTLEENRYRKIVQADARRVAWFVNNNLAEDYEQMPKSMRKKWSRANYGRERYLAKEFMKHKKSEQKLREMVRESIMDLVTEAKVEIAVNLKDFNKVKKIVKKIKGELVKHPFAKKTFGVKVDKNMYDKALEFLMKNKIDVRG